MCDSSNENWRMALHSARLLVQGVHKDGRELTLEEVLAALCSIQREVSYRAHGGKRGDRVQSAYWRAAFCALGSHYCSAPNADRDLVIDRVMNANAFTMPTPTTLTLHQSCHEKREQCEYCLANICKSLLSGGTSMPWRCEKCGRVGAGRTACGGMQAMCSGDQPMVSYGLNTTVQSSPQCTLCTDTTTPHISSTQPSSRHVEVNLTPPSRATQPHTSKSHRLDSSK